MKKKSLWIITALMTLALLGVFVMQMYYIRESYNLKSQLFEQDVNQALTAVVNKIQKKNVINRFNKRDVELKELEVSNIRSKTDSIVAFKERYKENKARRMLKQQQQIFKYLSEQDSIIQANYLKPEIISEEDYAILSNPNPNKNTLTYKIDEFRTADGVIVGRKVSANFNRKRPVIRLNNLPDSIIYLAYSPADFRPQFIILPTIEPELKVKFKLEESKAEHNYKMELERLYADTVSLLNNRSNVRLLQDVAKEMATKDIPLVERMPSQEIVDTLIKKELLSRNIDLAYNYWVTPSQNTGKVIYRNVSLPSGQVLPKNTFSTVIFSNDLMIKDPGMLYVSFPNKNSLIFNNMFVTLASSIGLLLVLVSIFAYTIYAIIRQKKLSEMKTDFINNMTHEFKTPVATIMIASEALKDPDLTPDKARINRLAGIIYDENVRLGNHIERVLNVAKLDKKELKLERNPVNMNDLIAVVVDSMSLQLQKKNAQVDLQLEAANDLVIGDELHLSNMIYNLVDNANKYSPQTPVISIKTKNQANGIVVEVSDEGIGMTKDQAKRIFDQFYRVPTGNLHDVKGFGLGLSYVSDIVEQMNGNIKVNSEKDKGTTFTIYLPFKLSN
ncbi:sensor histidine kinase [Nubsella zeaxanthinifaciens]|uniref:sensor histidine kinase n=1 Tax=Nubsella zeaxanthinifaciens TaxID=392412 RepID=UPI000DE1BF3E|nr:HAMP domain-containing sensor histidine kinase [Nubsella zeaxanthinifaciens]